MAQSVGQEHGVGTGVHGLVHIAAHQTELLQPLGHQPAYGKVHVHVFHTGTGHLEHIVVAGLHDGVDIKLPLGESAVHGEGAGVVAAVVVHGLGAAVAKGQTAVLKQSHRRVAVHNLTVLREDSGETHLGTVRVGDAVYLAAHEFLRHTGTGEPHGGGVHLVADGGGALQGFYLLGLLHRAHGHNGLDECHRGGCLLLAGVDAQQVVQLYFDVVAVGGQEVEGAALAAGLVAEFLQVAHRSAVGYTHLGLVDVNHAHQAVALLTEVVEKRGVLAEGVIGVGGVVARRLVVAEEQNDAVAHEFFQAGAAVDIGLFAEHSIDLGSLCFYFLFIAVCESLLHIWCKVNDNYR